MFPPFPPPFDGGKRRVRYILIKLRPDPVALPFYYGKAR
jgi:hypothetical protein